MAVPILEAFADAIQHHEGWKPWSRSYRNRNPGNLRPLNGAQPHDSGDYRTFPTFVDGYNALLSDLHAKFTGHSAHKVGPNSTLLEFFSIYAPVGDHNMPKAYAEDVCGWLHSAYCQNFTLNDTLLYVVREVGQEALLYGVPRVGDSSQSDGSESKV